jgi:hypothetical protein
MYEIDRTNIGRNNKTEKILLNIMDLLIEMNKKSVSKPATKKPTPTKPTKG